MITFINDKAMTLMIWPVRKCNFKTQNYMFPGFFRNKVGHCMFTIPGKEKKIANFKLGLEMRRM